MSLSQALNQFAQNLGRYPRDNAITAAALAATNLVENFTFILFLLPWDISTSFICQPTRGMCA